MSTKATSALRQDPEFQSDLGVIEDALLDEAHRRAQDLIEAAGREVDEVVERARTQAREIIEASQAEGRAAAAQVTEADIATALSDANSIVLLARRVAYDQLRVEAIRALRDHAGDPEMGAYEHEVAGIVAARLGPGATVQGTLTSDSGIVAVLGARRASVNLESLVDYHLRFMTGEIAELWS